MIEHAYFAISDCLEAKDNEEKLDYYYNNIPDDSLVVFLWQNKDNISIGRNEIYLRDYKLYDCTLVRRSTDGDAYYEDRGSINIGFMMYLNNFSVNELLGCITNCLKKIEISVSMKDYDLFFNENKLTFHDIKVMNEKCLFRINLLVDTDMERFNELTRTEMSYTALKTLNAEISMTALVKELLQQISNKYGDLYRIKIEN